MNDLTPYTSDETDAIPGALWELVNRTSDEPTDPGDTVDFLLSTGDL